MTEKELYELKWFDYRILPVEGCDLLFILRYMESGAHYQSQLGFSRYAGRWFRKFDVKNYRESIYKRKATSSGLRSLPTRLGCLKPSIDIPLRRARITRVEFYSSKCLLMSATQRNPLDANLLQITGELRLPLYFIVADALNIIPIKKCIKIKAAGKGDDK